jgi:hypothetical protein
MMSEMRGEEEDEEEELRFCSNGLRYDRKFIVFGLE